MDINELRSEYGNVSVSLLNDRVIPWRLLSLGEFQYYESCLKQEKIIPEILEDEVFKKCVLDKWLVENTGYLPAGLITTVTQNIMNASGPQGLDEFNNALEEQREIANEPIHNLVGLIVAAFPAYKLEDVYAMPYDTFLLRLAQAEPVLLRMQIISEPIKLMTPEEIEKRSKKNKRRPPGPAPDLRAAWEKQTSKRTEPVPSPPPTQPVAKPIPPRDIKPHPVKPGESPIFDTATGKPKKVKGLELERLQIENNTGNGQGYDGQSAQDREKMLAESKVLYKDVLAKLAARKK